MQIMKNLMDLHLTFKLKLVLFSYLWNNIKDKIDVDLQENLMQ